MTQRRSTVNPRNSTCLIPLTFLYSWHHKRHFMHDLYIFQGNICSRWVQNVSMGAKRVQKLISFVCGCTVCWQHSHYPPWCRPRSWYRLRSSVCWAQPSPADSAGTWEHRHTGAGTQDVRGNQQIQFCFLKQTWFLCVCVCLTSSWTRCSRFLYVFWTSSLVPSTPYHIMFLVRLLQEETAEGRTNQRWFCFSRQMIRLQLCLTSFLGNLVLQAWRSCFLDTQTTCCCLSLTWFWQITSFIKSVMEKHVLYTHISTRDATLTEKHYKQLQYWDKCRDNWVIYTPETFLLNPFIYTQFQTFLRNIEAKIFWRFSNKLKVEICLFLHLSSAFT